MEACMEVTRILSRRQRRMSVGGIGIGLAAAIALVLAPVCSGAGKSKSPQIGMAKIKAGMQTPVGSENKGYHMLQKMGWTHGDGLGEKGAGGMLDPINPLDLSVQTGSRRGGIGQDSDFDFGGGKGGGGGGGGASRKGGGGGGGSGGDRYRGDKRRERDTKKGSRKGGGQVEEGRWAKGHGDVFDDVVVPGLPTHGMTRKERRQLRAMSDALNGKGSLPGRKRGGNRGGRSPSPGRKGKGRGKDGGGRRGIQRGGDDWGGGAGGGGGDPKQRQLTTVLVKHLHKLPDEVQDALEKKLRLQARRLKLPEWVFDDIWEMCLDSRVGALPLPATLTAFQRQQVHIMSFDMGLDHKSIGKGSRRHLTVSKAGYKAGGKARGRKNIDYSGSSTSSLESEDNYESALVPSSESDDEDDDTSSEIPTSEMRTSEIEDELAGEVMTRKDDDYTLGRDARIGRSSRGVVQSRRHPSLLSESDDDEGHDSGDAIHTEGVEGRPWLSKGQGESVPVTPSQRSSGSGRGGGAQFSTASATPLGEENKGFKMLQAMGWKGGSDSGLGAQEQGTSTPVSVHSRLGRTGLGHQAGGKDARDAEEERRKGSELLIFVQNEIRQNNGEMEVSVLEKTLRSGRPDLLQRMGTLKEWLGKHSRRLRVSWGMISEIGAKGSEPQKGKEFISDVKFGRVYGWDHLTEKKNKGKVKDGMGVKQQTGEETLMERMALESISESADNDDISLCDHRLPESATLSAVQLTPAEEKRDTADRVATLGTDRSSAASQGGGVKDWFKGWGENERSPAAFLWAPGGRPVGASRPNVDDAGSDRCPQDRIVGPGGIDNDDTTSSGV